MNRENLREKEAYIFYFTRGIGMTLLFIKECQQNWSQAIFFARPFEGVCSSFLVPEDSGFLAQSGALSASYR